MAPANARPTPYRRLVAAAAIATAVVALVGTAAYAIAPSRATSDTVRPGAADPVPLLAHAPPVHSLLLSGETGLRAPDGIQPAQSDDSFGDIELATGDEIDIPMVFYAFAPNTELIFGEAVASGSGAALVSPTFLDFGELGPGQYSEIDTIVQAPDTPGNYELVWEASCYAADGCTTTPPVWVIDIDVISDDDSNPVASSVSVDCSPGSIQQDDWTLCQATVTGSADTTPTGTIFWDSDSETGAFAYDYCVLDGGTCETYYSDSTVGTAEITAEYSGDANNIESSSSPAAVEITASPLTSPTVLVGCDPASIYAGGTTDCTASVSGTNPTGSIYWESSSNDYSISSVDCTLSGGACDVQYADSTVGTSTLYAYYSGDANNLPGAGTTELPVQAGTAPTTTSVECDPSGISPSDVSDCTATVTGETPTGTAVFTAAPALGELDPLTCELDEDGSCDVNFTGALPGTVEITATYSGDDLNAQSSGSTTVTIAPASSTSVTTVACSPSHPQTNSTVSCTATVKGSKPTGTIAWSSASLQGSFSADTCTLSTGTGKRTCSVTFTPTAAGSGDVTAAYLGDASNGASSGSAKLVVHVPPKYAVTVTESGLPASTEWWFNLTGGTSHHSTSTSLTFQEPNGSYAYTLGSKNKKYDGVGGTLTVDGGTVALTATFSPVTFTITFKESGLPSGAEWWVNITGGASYHSTSAKISVTETNGSYAYTVSTSRSGYTAASGTVKVAGAAVTKKITFTS